MMIMSAAFWKNTCLMKTRNVLKKKKKKDFISIRVKLMFLQISVLISATDNLV